MKIKPDILFIDALKIDINIKQISIIKGDLKSYSIGCASILAKVCRDEIMNNLPEEYQKYKISKIIITLFFYQAFLKASCPVPEESVRELPK